jgi:hypothetical protein
MLKSERRSREIAKACLDEVMARQELIDSILEEQGEAKDSDLYADLRTLTWLKSKGEQLDPRPGFVEASRKRLVQQIKTRPDRVNESGAGKLWESLGMFLNRKRSWQVSAILILLVALIFGNYGAALASRDTIPGDRLYWLKLTQERVYLALAYSEEQRITLNVDFSQRRIAEIEKLVQTGRYEYVDEVVEWYGDHLNQATNGIQALGQRQYRLREELVGKTSLVFAAHSEILTSLLENVPASQKKGIGQALDVTKQKNALLIETQGNGTPGYTQEEMATASATAVPTGPQIEGKRFNPGPAKTPAGLSGEKRPTQKSSGKKDTQPAGNESEPEIEITPGPPFNPQGIPPGGVKPPNPNKPTSKPTNMNKPTPKSEDAINSNKGKGNPGFQADYEE